MSLEIYGIRHHGPGSARSVLRALDTFDPDAVLVEGPVEAGGIIPFANDAAMHPPVAILAYASDAPKRRSLVYPFATFSPELQALRWALARGRHVAFVDLPLANVLAPRHNEPVPPRHPEPVEGRRKDPATPDPTECDAGEEDDDDDDDRTDPLEPIARAAGYTDGERFWDAFVERRRSDADAFAALEELMSALRERRGRAPLGERRREAAMRAALRTAQKTYERVAFICGAWHAPAMRESASSNTSAKADADTLRGLPKTKVTCTWIPWTHSRLSYASGYGAGIESPGWYEHLWLDRGDPIPGWMTKAARTLRDADLDIGPAYAIEATRLAHALAAIRDTPAPGLAECDDAIRAIYCFGDATPMRLLAGRLVVGERLGAVPDTVPIVPLAADVAREQKRLRLAPDTSARELDLDLRKPGDLDRSRLLHRLNVLGVPWGTPRRRTAAGSGTSTFHEVWDVRWQPEFAIALVESARFGNTVAEAATASVRERAARADADLAELTGLLDAALAAALDAAVADVLRLVRDGAARTHDATVLLDAIPPLVQIRRYGDVRGTDSASVSAIARDLITRASLALPGACLALDDAAAEAMLARIVAVDAALRLGDVAGERAAWDDALRRVHGSDRTHGLVAARALRLRFDAGRIDAAMLGERLGFELCRASDPAQAAAWIDGLVRGSGAILVHEERLLRTLDAWLLSLDAERFIATLPLVRRTFATFAPPERAAIGAHLAAVLGGGPRARTSGDDDLVWERALLGMPTLAAILGRSAEGTR